MRRHNRKPDTAYLEFIRAFPCALCRLGRQSSVTEAAHVGDRGLMQKSSDRKTIPLCAEHHRLGKYSQHRLGKKFWNFYGLDRDKLIAELNYIFENQVAA